VHDNFDPQQLGKTPKDLGLEYSTWDEVERKYLEKAKTSYRNRLMRELLLSSKTELVPSFVSKSLVEHCVSITKNVRDWMETHPKERQPADPVLYPGKFIINQPFP
jgi:hypothetical protein